MLHAAGFGAKDRQSQGDKLNVTIPIEKKHQIAGISFGSSVRKSARIGPIAK